MELQWNSYPNATGEPPAYHRNTKVTRYGTRDCDLKNRVHDAAMEVPGLGKMTVDQT